MIRLARRAVPLLAVAIALIAASGALADVIPQLDTSLTHGKVDYNPDVPDGIDSSAETGAPQLGAHADFNVDMHFNYGATGMDGPVEDPATYPAGTDYRETVKNLVVDIPPGLVGNPNAVPSAERCDPATFATSECPASATVGELWIKYSLMFDDDLYPPNALSIGGLGPKSRTGYVNNNSGYTTVSLLRTDPEVPAQIGLFIRGPIGYGPVRLRLEINPVTSEDLRLRTVTIDGIPNQISVKQVDEDDNVITVWRDLRLERMKLKLYGRLASGKAFMTSPTSCQPWVSTAWARAAYSNTNTSIFPLGAGTDPFTSPITSTVNPDCSNQAAVPFPITGKVAISTPQRDTSPDFNFTIDDPGVQSDGDDVATSPKKIVTTIPASLNVDVQQLGRTCTVPDFNADKCPATSRVGDVQIKTPLISAGLTGDVYLVKEKPSGLPDLGLRVRGAISFTQRGSNRYVGAKFNQIETTFDNIPQVGFTQLTFHLTGGKDGLLRSLACPLGNKQPAPGTFAYTFTGYTGASVSSSAQLNMANCFGIQKLRSFKCVYRVLRFQPTYTSRARIKSVLLKVDKKRVATARRSPFKFTVPAKKFKKGKHKFEVQAKYDDGTISTKRSSFKKCGR